MNITVTRFQFTEISTISRVEVDGIDYGYMLEDCDRGLEQSWPLERIRREKIKARTAIPAGRYEVIINHSPRFGRPLPLLLGVPGYEGIRIHSGRTPLHTEGCLLPGRKYAANQVLDSPTAAERLGNAIREALIREKVFIDIRRVDYRNAESPPNLGKG